MNIQITPKILIQYILEETAKGLIIFLNTTINSFPAEVQEDLLFRIPRSFITKGVKGLNIDSPGDVKILLDTFWKNWDVLQEKIIPCEEVIIYGRVYRSYISILLQARNEWAHTTTFSYDDVIFYGLAARRFFSSQLTVEVSSALDEIVEEGIQKLIPGQGKVDVPESTTTEPIKTSDVLEVMPSTPKHQPVDRLQRDDSSKALEILVNLVRDERYEDIAKIIDYPKSITLPQPKFPNTFCLSDGQTTFAFGANKFELIKKNLDYVVMFALTGETIPIMRGEFKGNPTLCLPSNSETHLQIGQVKAQIVCMKMKEISDWLKSINQGNDM